MPLNRNIFLLLFLFIALPVSAQKTDSLKRALHTTGKDNERVYINLELADIYSQIDNDSSVMYAWSGFQIAQKSGIDTCYIDAAIMMAIRWQWVNKADSATKYYKLAYERSKQSGLKARQIKVLTTWSRHILEQTQFKDALKLLDEATQLAIDVNDKKNEAAIDEIKVDAYSMMHNYEQALVCATKALKINDSLKNAMGTARSYWQIAQVYSEQHRYNEALKYGLAADSMFMVLDNQNYYIANRMELATIYTALGQYDKAIDIYHTYLSASHTASNAANDAFAYVALGNTLSLKGDVNGAMNALFTGLGLCKSISKYPPYTLFRDIAKAHQRTGHTDSALYYALEAEKGRQMMDEPGPTYPYKESMELISELYAGKGDMANAYKYHKIFSAVQDSLFSAEHTTTLAEAESKFRLQDKDNKLAALATEKELSKLKERAGIALLLVGCLVIIIIIAAYRRSLRRNEILSDQKKLIDQQVVQLADAAEMKSKFLGNVSHELRTPVTLLTGMLGLMRNDNEPDVKKKDRLGIAYNNSRKLQQMVEELLDMTRLEKNEARLNLEVKEAKQLIKRMVYAFETLVEKEQLTLLYDDKSVHDVFIKTDENKLEKVINNLIYNAIKFTGKGGYIKVALTLCSDKKNICLEISDSGRGISEEDLPHIFERYYQGKTGGNAEGVGIGLSLVKEFTELLNGSISVSGKVGEGTTFLLQFPLTEFVAEDKTDEVIQLPQENWAVFPQKQKVLLVEDNAEMRYYLKEILADKVNISEATNGVEALALLQNSTPDLIITDIMMPEMDGKEFITRLKQHDSYKKIPVITLTALAAMEHQLTLLRMGVDDHIVKPFDADELRIRVYNLLNNQLSRREFISTEPAEADDLPVDNKEADEFRAKITEYVLARLNNFDVSVDDMAIELGVSRPQLYRFAKSLTGCTPAQLIKEVKLMKAYELLLGGDVHKIEDLCRRVGYEHQGYFSRQFLERFGKRPSDFL